MTRPRLTRRQTPRVSFRDALNDPQLLGNVLPGASWQAWRVSLIAAMGERLTDAERELFKQLTGREREPGQRVEEFAAVVGRRGGKSRGTSVIATHIAGRASTPRWCQANAACCSSSLLIKNKRTSCWATPRANFLGSPILRQLIEARTQRTLRLTNGIDIEVRASDFRRLRGPPTSPSSPTSPRSG